MLKEWDLDNVPVNSGSLKILRFHLLKSNVMLIFAIALIRVSIKIVKDIVTEQFSKRYSDDIIVVSENPVKKEVKLEYIFVD